MSAQYVGHDTVRGDVDVVISRSDTDNSGKVRYLNRELSWVAFNARVLALAEDQTRPLLERLKFLAIVSSNFDEFFQVRVSGLKEQLATGVVVLSPDGLSPLEQLEAIREVVGELVDRQSRVLLEEILPGLAEAGIELTSWAELGDEAREFLSRHFRERIFPVLTPLSVDPAHPFPHISNLSVNLAVAVRDRDTGTTRFARVKVPALLPRFVQVDGGDRFVPLEQVIAAHLDELFPGMDVVSHHLFRPTRNADLDLEEDEGADLLDTIEAVLRGRRLNPMVVRLEVERGMPLEALSLLMRELSIESFDVYRVDGPLGLKDLWSLYSLDRPDLKDDPWVPVVPPVLSTGRAGSPSSIFEAIDRGDVLVHHPYDSFSSSAEAFVDQAARDPCVLAIKQTLYRTSGDSPIVRSLIRAAEAGKQVVALVELKARFDEEANIAWARILEEAGVHVVYGVVGLKTHAKVALVVRQEKDRIRLYCHVGTGNYNPRTATIYEDVGLLTASPDIGADVVDLFNYLTGYSRQLAFRQLFVAPTSLRGQLIGLIRREAGRRSDGRIVLKMNSLVDAAVIDALYEASQAGVQIDLVVRGICCLQPGVEGLSENIRVRSLVGRYLEHSRIYRFGDGSTERPDYYIGSADLMPRNLDRRVEALVPVLAPALRARLQEILDVNLTDDVLAWQLGPDGVWEKVPTSRGIAAHDVLQDRALERANGNGKPHV
jgi:polyphosphate kinase